MTASSQPRKLTQQQPVQVEDDMGDLLEDLLRRARDPHSWVPAAATALTHWNFDVKFTQREKSKKMTLPTIKPAVNSW